MHVTDLLLSNNLKLLPHRDIAKRACCADLGRSSITDLGRSSISGRMALLMLPTNTDESDHCSLQEAFRKFRRKKQVSLSSASVRVRRSVFSIEFTRTVTKYSSRTTNILAAKRFR